MVSWGEFRGALLAAGAFVAAVLAVTIVQPGLPGELILQSLRFHIIAAGLGVALLLVTTGARWRGALLALLMVAAGVQGAGPVTELLARRVDHAEAPLAQFRILSFNVLVGNRRSAELVEAVLDDPPDVMLVMETPGIEDHLARLATILPYRLGCEDSRTCDIALLSRFPLEEAEMVQLAPLDNERLVKAALSVDGQRVTIVGAHFSKPHHDNVTPIEFWRVHRFLGEIDGPLVLAGDFNAAPWSYPVAELARAHNLAPGPWMPATWPVRLGPLGVPIDNMFARGAAQIVTLEAGDNLGSNHRPLWAEIGLYGTD